MKNKILCLLLCAFLVVGGVIFSACNSGGYSLKNFTADYNKIAEHKGIGLDNKGCLVFDFNQIRTAIIAKDGEPEVEPCSTSLELFYEPFEQYYSPLTQNSLIFISHIKGQLANGEDVHRDKRNKVKEQLENLENAAVNVQAKIVDFVGIINMTTSSYIIDRTNAMDILADELCKFYNSCRELSITLADVFFKDVLKNENKNYFATPNNYASVLMETLPDLAYYHIFNATQNFVEMNVEGEDTDFVDVFADYKKSMDDILSYAEKLEGKTLTTSPELYSNAVALFNLNSKVINEREMYLKACNNIVYTQVKRDGSSDYKDSADLLVIEGYGDALDEYTNVLLNIFKTTGAN